MKTSLRFTLACCMALSASFAGAELIAHDGFEAAPAGGFNGYDGGTNFLSGYTARDGAKIAVGNLNYLNGEISVQGGSAYGEIKKNPDNDILFYRQFPTFNGETLYMSFLIRVSPESVDTSKEHFFSLGVANQISEPTGGVEIRYNTGKTWHDLGIRSGSKDYKTDAGEMSGETTYFVVLKLHKLSSDAAAKYKDLQLFVNPSTLAEPETCYIACTNDSLNNAQYLSCRIARSMADSDNRYDVDEIRLGSTWTDVVAPVVRTDITPRPLFTPLGRSFTGTQNVDITCPGFPEAAIYYTLDGSEPTPQTGTLYTGTLSLTSPATVRAVAVAGNLPASLLNAATYAREIHWTGEGDDDNWGTAANWSPAGSPAGQCVVFGAEDRTVATTVNNIIPADLQIYSLTYTNSNVYPPETSKGRSYHVLQIAPEATLTVTGCDSLGRAFTMTGPYLYSGQYRCNVTMTGGGTFAVDSPDAEFLMTINSTDHTGYPNLDVSGLSSFTVNAEHIWNGWGARVQSSLLCAKTGAGKNVFRAGILSLGDSSVMEASKGGGTSETKLGTDNTFHCDRIQIAGAPPGRPNDQSGSVTFSSGLQNPSLTIRARDGVGRAYLEVGSHGHNSGSPRAVSGTLNLSGGTVDALVSDFYLGNGSGHSWSASYGGVNGVFAMDAGVFDATNVYLARSFYNSGSRNTTGNPATGTATVNGGRFTAGTVSVGLNDSDAMQSVNGNFILNGGEAVVSDSLVLGTRLGTASNVRACLAVSNGVFTVARSLSTGVIEGDRATFDYKATVDVAGGVLAVTNTTGDAEFALPDGTLALSGGRVIADSLAIGENGGIAVTLSSSAPCGEVLADGDVELAGSFTAVCAEGYVPRGGEVWTIVSGGVRNGEFGTLDIPENMRLRYRADGFALECPAPATLVIIR